jgi:hypothetical protein
MEEKRSIFIRIVIGAILLTTYACTTASKGPVNSPEGTTTTFILVRHAERNDKKGESPLRPEGLERARDLVKAVGDMGITAIYTPNRGRNKETVRPLADHLGLELTIVPEKRLTNTKMFADEFVKEVLTEHAGGVVLWVGNKSPVGVWGGNLKEIYARLGGTENPPGKYDDLFIIKVPDKGTIQVTKTSYGKAAGRFDQSVKK